MVEIQTFLSRLGHIVADPCTGEENSARAVELFGVFRDHLYAQYDVHWSKRPTFHQREQVDSALAELRRFVLRAEVATQGDSRSVFTCVRHRIEMTRRGLAAHIPCEEPHRGG